MTSGTEGGAIKWRVLLSRSASKPEADLFSGGVAHHLFHFVKAQPVHGWYRLKDLKKGRRRRNRGEFYGTCRFLLTVHHTHKSLFSEHILKYTPRPEKSHNHQVVQENIKSL